MDKQIIFTTINKKKLWSSDVQFLYKMLQERDDSINISHKEMPDYHNHIKFIKSTPYKYWWIINLVEEAEGEEEYSSNRIGNIYLTKNNEIGIFILKEYQKKGYGKIAITKFIKETKEDYYIANINPLNLPSIKLFNSLGFKHIQNSYKLNIDREMEGPHREVSKEKNLLFGVCRYSDR